MKKIKYLLFLILCLSCSLTYAQKRISGHVWNAKDGPIMMANVIEIDENNRIQASTTTDMSGNFTLAIKNPNDVLKVYFFGYRPWERKIGTQTVFKIELQTNTRTIKEVKVTGRKMTQSNGLSIPEREVSVATQKLDMDEMEGLSFESADQALQGQIAGLDVVANSGNLGSGMSMRVRGVSTISGNQEPLIVVDGHILENYESTDVDLQDMDNNEQFANLLNVNVEDIKSIEVKKDAGSCAIWGSRGANGVIEITTRRGVRGKTRVSGNYYFTGSWQPKGMNMLNGDGYTMMLKEAYFNPKQSDLTSNMVELNYNRSRTMYYANFNKNTDWVDEVTQFGQSHKYYVSVTGGGDQATFRISGGYDHETGTIIKQVLNRLSTRMVLDYKVSDRITFSSNFALTYTKNNQNYANILAKAYNAMPNMAVNRWEYDPYSDSYYDTGEYYKLYPRGTEASRLTGTVDGTTSYYLNDMIGNGNPVAIANLSWKHISDYSISPQFELEYKLMGKDNTKTQLNYKGEVYMSSKTTGTDTYYPGELTTATWSSNINLASNIEKHQLSFSTIHQLVFIPLLPKDHSFQILGRGEIKTSTSNTQTMYSSGLVGGITDPTVDGYLYNSETGTSTSKSHDANLTASFHYAYKSKYVLDGTLRADGSANFGKDKRWGYFPSLSARWNISDEYFFRPLKKYISMFSFAPGWGMTGNSPSTNSIMFNKYSQGNSYGSHSTIYPANLRLTDVRWEKTSSWNLGFNVNFLEDLACFNFNIYRKHTTDLLQKSVSIPTSTGYSSLDYKNVGTMDNYGWDLNAYTKPIFKIGKFSMKLKFNAAQNRNRIKEMDASVLAGLNGDFTYKNATASKSGGPGNYEGYLSRVQVGNALYSIYGFRYLGVYRYDYDHCGYFPDYSDGTPNVKNTMYGSNTAAAAAARGENATTPVARDANGNIIYDGEGYPLRMYFNYGATNYQFSGGDAIYEDINHDGQINEMDIVYLGNSNPTFNGGFGVDFTYGKWTLKTSFNIRLGAKIVNLARMAAEDMRTNKNQSRAVSWRWRKNGDITEIPRALSSNIVASYNALPSSRYVENSDYIRLQYMQLTYTFDKKLIKKFGCSSLKLSASANNLFFFTKYSGVDPEHSASGYNPAYDTSQTPRSRSITFSLNVSF